MLVKEVLNMRAPMWLTGLCVDRVKKSVDFSLGLKCLACTEVECSLCKSGKMPQIEKLGSF